MGPKIDVAVYPSASPMVVGERLFDDDLVKDIDCVCEALYYQHNPEGVYPQQEVAEYVEEFHTVISFLRHVEITVTEAQLAWEALSNVLLTTFPQLAWTGASREVQGDTATYYFDFIPIAYKEKAFPFAINASLAFHQLYPATDTEVEAAFLADLHALVASVCVPLGEDQGTEEPLVAVQDHPATPPFLEAEGLASREATTVFHEESAAQVEALTAALETESAEVQRLTLENKKLTTVLAQVERMAVSQAKSHLSPTKGPAPQGWNKRVRVDFRTYLLLVRKAKFLEQIWVKNQELIRETEKLTLQKEKLVYEREQLRSFKQAISSKEIYFLLDECQSIEARVKIKKGWWFLPPRVVLMQMDYESLQNKAAYFDLIQGENALLEKMVTSGTLEEERDLYHTIKRQKKNGRENVF